MSQSQILDTTVADTDNNVGATESSVESTPETVAPKYKSLREIYKHTEPMDLVGDLYMIGVEEPTDFQEASKEEHWRSAMEVEMEAIEKNNTWKLTPLPHGHKPIGLK